MSYHDSKNYWTEWGGTKKATTDTERKQPRMQIISPQKKLLDIQLVLNALPEKAMTVVELQEAIQRILDGE